MIKAIPYHSFEEKPVTDTTEPLSNTEALIRALDLLDFYAAFRSLNDEVEQAPTDDGINWIELKFLDNDK